MKSYSELITIPTFEDRVRYLMLKGSACDPYVEQYRHILQRFYHSNSKWTDEVRRAVIIRDNACDLAMPGFEIVSKKIFIHHINPISVDDIIQNNVDKILGLENLICTTQMTHNAIHYSDESILFTGITQRAPNDTCPWK